MKIKVFEYIYRIQDGGAETLIKDYAQLLNKEIFDVTIVCCDAKKNSAIYKTLIENKIEVIELYKPFNIIHKIITKLFGKKHIANLLKKLIKKTKPNIIHIHLESLEVFTYCSDYLKGIKLFYTCHNVPKTMIGSDLPKENKAVKYLIKNNNLQIIALYKDMANEINKLLAINTTKVINNGIDFNNFLRSNKTKEEIRKELNITINAFVVGHTGRFTYQKNHEKIIEVFNEIVKMNTNSFLLLIGLGNNLDKIKQMINNYNLNSKVLILSNRNDVSELLLAMDVFLFPSRYEGISIALIEAQARDLLCVVSNRVNSETFFSNKIIELDINDSNKLWADSCINPTNYIKTKNNKNYFNLAYAIKKLEDLYLN